MTVSPKGDHQCKIVARTPDFRVSVNFLQSAWGGRQECVSKCGEAKGERTQARWQQGQQEREAWEQAWGWEDGTGGARAAKRKPTAANAEPLVAGAAGSGGGAAA